MSMTAPTSALRDPLLDRLAAYAFWFFLGAIGAHRFYWGKYKSAIGMCALLLLGIPLFLFGILAGAAGISFESISGALAGGGTALIGFAMIGAHAIWWLLDAVFILLWDPR